jgi:hypothetical protein
MPVRVFLLTVNSSYRMIQWFISVYLLRCKLWLWYYRIIYMSVCILKSYEWSERLSRKSYEYSNSFRICCAFELGNYLSPMMQSWSPWKSLSWENITLIQYMALKCCMPKDIESTRHLNFVTVNFVWAGDICENLRKSVCVKANYWMHGLL